jgi:hypothetical protein
MYRARRLQAYAKNPSVLTAGVRTHEKQLRKGACMKNGMTGKKEKEDGKTQYWFYGVHSVLLPESFTALGKQFAPSVLLAESLQRLVRAAVLLPERVTSSAPFLFY